MAGKVCLQLLQEVRHPRPDGLRGELPVGGKALTKKQGVGGAGHVVLDVAVLSGRVYGTAEGFSGPAPLLNANGGCQKEAVTLPTGPGLRLGGEPLENRV